MKNYFSLWIENLGVDPLLSSMFFLAFPAFFLLNFLLHLVCIVFEAIILPLPLLKQLNYNFRPLFLSIYKSNVKVFLMSYVALTLCNNAYSSNIKEIFISTGEQVEINEPQIRKYSVGNKDVIKHKHRAKYGKILIKGKKMGFSDLVIWKKKEKVTYHLYVISKKQQLEKISLIESLKRMNLKIRTQGEIVYVFGEISTFEQFFLISKINMKNHKNLILDVSINKKLRNELYSKIYLELYNDGASKVICKNYGIKITCSLQGISLTNSSIQYLKEKFFVSFSHRTERGESKNYIASLKIIQVEISNSQHFKIGPSKISSSVQELVQTNNFLQNEMINISNTKANLKILAEPVTTLILNEKAKIQLGGEIPFTTSSTDNKTIQKWKFYGLKIETVLRSVNGNPLIQYSTELTSPSNKSINGSKGKSSVYIKKDEYVKLFEVGYQVDNNNREYLPILGEIPFLRNLFSNESNTDSYKHIICYIKLEEK